MSFEKYCNFESDNLAVLLNSTLMLQQELIFKLESIKEKYIEQEDKNVDVKVLKALNSRITAANKRVNILSKRLTKINQKIDYLEREFDKKGI